MVYWLNTWFLFVHSSSSNIFFKIARRPFGGHGEKVNLYAAFGKEYVFLFIEIYWSKVEDI
jgi:hypothetical protein